MVWIGFSTNGRSTDEVRHEGAIRGLETRFSKTLLGGPIGHQDRLTGVYSDIIELNGGSHVAAGGFVTTFGLIGGSAAVYLYREWIPRMLEHPSSGIPVLFFSAISLYCVFLIGVYHEMFSPSEMPILFDRARRKVYYVHRAKRRRFFLFGPSHVEARVTDWSLVDAEHHTTLRATTASAGRDDHLVFLMRRSESDPTIVDSYVVSNLQFPSALWSYIVGYMDHGAPPLNNGETPPYKGAMFDMAEALRQRRKDYWRDWRDFTWTQFWQHLVLPVFMIYYLVNRCVVWSAQKVKWPQEVIDALGPAVTEEDLQGSHSSAPSSVHGPLRGGTSFQPPAKPHRKTRKKRRDRKDASGDADSAAEQ